MIVFKSRLAGKSTAACFLWLSVFIAPHGVAQQSSVFVDIGPCMSQTPSAARHACYDELEAGIRQAQQNGLEATVSAGNAVETRIANSNTVDPPRPAAPANPEQTETEIADFGNNTPSTLSSAKLEQNEQGEQVMHDRVVSLHERTPDQWLITLASGQVWHQINSKRFALREGMEIRIYPSPLGGSWRMAGSSMKGFIQVKRIE